MRQGAIWAMIGAMALQGCVQMAPVGASAPLPTAPLPAAPASPASEIGVSRTRSGPNRSSNPRVAPKGPPAAPISSPSRMTDGSSAIASAKARFTACTMRSSAMAQASTGA